MQLVRSRNPGAEPLIVTGATVLFLQLGYDRTSLARIAECSGVSRATLFKQFPSKAALFDAIVTGSWSTADEEDPPPAGNVVDRLGVIGRRYAELLGRARMTDLFRIVIAELPRFPELAHAQFSHGKMPYFESVAATSWPSTRRERCGSRTWTSQPPSSWA